MPTDHMVRQVLVTGSSSGIGEAIVKDLLLQGLVVHGWDKTEPNYVENNFIHTNVDLTNDDEIRVALDFIKKQSSIDAIIHCAGWMKTSELEQLNLDDGDEMWKIHVRSITQIVKALLPYITSVGNGRVVLIGSRVASGKAGRSQYAAVKAALIALARSWAAELITKGVTVNVVSPAATKTKMLSDVGRESQMPKLPPIGRFIDPSEVASLVSYLLSPKASAITGQNLLICGGSSLDM